MEHLFRRRAEMRLDGGRDGRWHGSEDRHRPWPPFFHYHRRACDGRRRLSLVSRPVERSSFGLMLLIADSPAKPSFELLHAAGLQRLIPLTKHSTSSRVGTEF